MIVCLFSLVEVEGEVEEDEQLIQLGEVVGDEVEGADSNEHVWLSCQLESRDPDQPACCKRNYQRSQNNLVMLLKVISL